MFKPRYFRNPENVKRAVANSPRQVGIRKYNDLTIYDLPRNSKLAVVERDEYGPGTAFFIWKAFKAAGIILLIGGMVKYTVGFDVRGRGRKAPAWHVTDMGKKYELEVGYSNGNVLHGSHDTRCRALGAIAAQLRVVTFPLRIVTIILKHPDGEVENFTRSPFDN